MARSQRTVPFGYEPPKGKGTQSGCLWVYDSFEEYTEQDLQRVLETADDRGLAQIVFYPLHDETLRRMEKQRTFAPYYRRVEELEALLEAQELEVETTIDRFEGKRKKYTPADTAFRFLEEKYDGPFFLFLREPTANLLAGYESFETWVKKLRLFIAGESGAPLHAKLEEHASRWERV